MSIGPLRPFNGWEKPFEPNESTKRDLYDLDCDIQEIPDAEKDKQIGTPSGGYTCQHSCTCTANEGHTC